MASAPSSPKIYHITHTDNLPNIAASGGLVSDANRIANSLSCSLVGMSTIKQRRLQEIEVSCHPGTKVGQYVPFYFCPRSIMLFILHKANNPESSDSFSRCWTSTHYCCGTWLVFLTGDANPMIELTQGDILKADVEALVNTVNCVGIMGRGIALQFKKAFPANFKAYETACKANQVQIGKMFIYDLNRLYNPRFIINFPTKRHWKGKSRIEDIKLGLADLIDVVQQQQIHSIAIPPLGCGLGGLNWEEVKPLIIEAFKFVPEVAVLLFEPAGAPQAAAMVKESKVPNMTVGRAALLGLMRRYLAAVMDPTVTLLEVHKLMYFMQEAGEPLRLNYQKATYGPYAENLRHVLCHIEGHFISGYGDAEDRPDKPLELKPYASDQAETFLTEHEATRQRFDRVADLIKGFETTFGMELLSTVHWVATREEATTPEEAVTKIHNWHTRKRMFELRHIHLAWTRLHEAGWLV